MSGFISYSERCAGLSLPLQKYPQTTFVWGKTLVTVHEVCSTFDTVQEWKSVYLVAEENATVAV